jgi:ABC-type branched-subunit amino acid transport system ATPase component/ABC-type branched-subunit amino acid transport system permease subunit
MARPSLASARGAMRSGRDRVDGMLPAPVRRVGRFPVVQAALLAIVALVIIAVAGPTSYTAYVVELICVYAVVVFGLNITVGFSGVLSLGQGAAFAIGAYVTGILAGTYAWPIWLALPLGLLAGLIVGVVTGLPAGRLAALGLAMVSLGTVLVLADMLVQFAPITGGNSGVINIVALSSFGPDGYITWEWFLPLLMVGAAFIGYWFHARYRTSSLGRATAAVRDEAIGSSALGISGYFTKVAAFAVGSALGALGGGLFAYLSQYISPDAFSSSLSILFLVMAVLGGLGSLFGPVVGVVVLVIVPLLLAPYPHVNTIVYGGLLIVLVRLRPRGLFTRTAAFADPVLRTLARLRAGNTAPIPAGERPAGEPTLAIHDVKRSFGGVAALAGVSLDVNPGEILGLIGPNGSGKTTLLNVICGLYRPEGEIVLQGTDITKMRPAEIARRGIARTFQTPKTFEGMSIDEHLELAASRAIPSETAYVDACREAAVALLGFGGLDPERANIGLTESRYLAHGQLRFLEAAMAVARCPKVLLLDEPAAGLSASEIDGLERVVKQLATAGMSVIIVEHHLEMISRLVDRIVVLDLGKVLWAGKPDELHDVEAVRVAYMGTV